jgi:hypothetical protein
MNTIAFYAIALVLFYGAWYGWVRRTGGWMDAVPGEGKAADRAE